MNKSALLIAMSSLVLVVGMSVSGYHLYQTNHISSDLRRTLTAAVDPNCSMNDELTYLRDARVQVRTQRDERLEGYLQSTVENMQAAEEAQQRTIENIQEHIPGLQASQQHDDDLRSWMRSRDALRAELGLPTLKRGPEEPQQ